MSIIYKSLSIAWRRFCRRWNRKNSYSKSSPSSTMAKMPKLPDLSPRLRLIFIIVAFIFLAIAAFILMLVILTTHNDELGHADQPTQDVSSQWLWRLKSMLNNHRTIVIFLSATFALFQLMAIGAAIFNWSIVLFSYVIITGIFGTIIGVVGIVGIIFTCILMRHDNHHDHTITITIGIVISFVFIFYLMTILGLRLMEYFRRRKIITKNNQMDKSIRNLRLNRNDGQGLNNNNNNHYYYDQNSRRPSSLYRSINSLSINDQRQLRDQIKNDININIDLDDDDDDSDDQNDNYDDDDDEQNQMTKISLLSSSNCQIINNNNNNNCIR